MAVGWFAWARGGLLLLGLLHVVGSTTAVAQSNDKFSILEAEVRKLANEGNYTEALVVAKRALALTESALGLEHPRVGTSLHNLAFMYDSLGRYAETEPLYKRSIAIYEKALGPEHPQIGMSLNNLAGVYERQGRFAEAERLLQRSREIMEKALGAEHAAVGQTLNNLASLYEVQGRYADAEVLYKRGLTIREKSLGSDHPDVGASLNNLAFLYSAQGRYAEAEPLYKRSLTIVEKALGREHFYVGHSLHNLAGLYFAQRDLERALELWRLSTALSVRRSKRGEATVGAEISKDGKDRIAHRFFGLVKVAHRLAAEQPGNVFALSDETFETAQWAHGSQAAASLAQMASRGAKGDAGLAIIVRERQDLVAEWQRQDGVQAAAMSNPPDKRERQAEAANAARLTEIDNRIAVIDARLKVEFPDYAALASPEALNIAQVQAELRTDEALVLIVDTPELSRAPEETFIWVVNKTDARWVRSDLGTVALTREVAALRCGLDITAWHGDGGARKCAELLKIAPNKLPKPNDQLPYDYARAHALYKALFGEMADLIKGKHLLLVPSGSLTQLPLQVLITEPPVNNEYRKMRWLARDHALTVLPAVSSLKALRRVAKPSAATRPMIGFGNPLLDGDQSDPQFAAYYKKRATLARASQSCPETPFQRIAAMLGVRRGVDPIAARGGVADLAHLKGQLPLPETAKELCDVAASLKVDRKDILLGARATEQEIKRLSRTVGAARLANYRIVHFATHGALAGQLKGTSEPGLILTPPTHATEEDDGYLSAGEIAGLKFDADWVILSACNTAGGAGGEGGAEALSGLARAFFYAQARALLVSHWEVNSDATVKLITSAVGAISRDKSVGRAEALRRAMLAMIDAGKSYEAHPAYWAPFVLVGEGAAAK